MGDTTQVILSVQAKQYSYYSDKETKKFIEEIKPRLRNVPVVCWTRTSNVFEIPFSEFSWDKLTRCKHKYSLSNYDPVAMLDRVGKVAQENDVATFEFILITDSVDAAYDWESFGNKLRTSSFYSNIKLVTLFFHGADADSVPPAFFRAFHGLPVKVQFEDLVIEIPKDVQVSNFSSKSGDYHSFLDNLGQYIYLNPIKKAQKDVFIQTLKDVEKEFLNDICRRQRSCLRPFGDRSPGEIVVRDFVENRRWAKLKKFYDQTLKRQWPMLAQRKFRTLYDLLEKSEIIFNDFRCFLPNQLYSYQGRVAFNIVNQEEESDIKDDTPERVPLCIVDQMDPEAPVIHYVPNTTLFYRDNTECDECPFLLLEYFNMASLNNDIACYRRAGDYKKPEVKEGEEEETYEYQRTGIILCKFQNLDNPESELLKPKTREDDVIVETIRAFADWRWGVRRNRGLVAIIFLFALYITDKVQNDDFFKKCIRYTIIRLSLIYKCNLPIFKSEYPHIYVRIYDALIYAMHVSCVESDPTKNFYSRIRSAGPYFVLLMESIYQQKFPQPYNVRCWLALDYMTKISEDDKKSMEAVAMTKVVGWIHTSKGPILLRGKKSDKCYHEILDGLCATDVFKLKKLIDDDVKLYETKFDFSLADVDITVTLPSVKPDTPLEEVYYKHVRICHSTCRPTINCQNKGASWKECLPKELRHPHLSFFNLFAKYCKEYEEYPTETDMMAYLAKSFPLECFYQNTQVILGHITKEFKQMNLEIATFLERFDKSKTLEKRKETEADCKCPVHNPVSIKHPQPKGIPVSTKHFEPKGIYVLVFAFNILFIILMCWLYL